MFHQGWGRSAPLARSSLASDDPMYANRIVSSRREFARQERASDFAKWAATISDSTSLSRRQPGRRAETRPAIFEQARVSLFLSFLPSRIRAFLNPKETRSFDLQSRNWLRFVSPFIRKSHFFPELSTGAKYISLLIFFLSPVSYLFRNFGDFVFFIYFFISGIAFSQFHIYIYIYFDIPHIYFNYLI